MTRHVRSLVMPRAVSGRGGRRGRTRLLLAVVTAMGLCAGGCASVPSGGRVTSGRSADRAELVDDPYVRIVPVPPGENWDTRRIVRGFVTASASFDDGHRVAKEYLLGAGTVWQPGARPGVTIYQGEPDYGVVSQSATQARVRVRGTKMGSIGGDGQYEAAEGPFEMIFELTKDPRSQWRIDRLPTELSSGLLLSQRDVDRAFRSLNLYFFAPDRERVVPNAIFLPLGNRQELAAQLVRALLDGPTAWLEPAVRNLFPKGTRLLGGVAITDGTATVNLSGAARYGDIAAMSSQLVWTLRQLPEFQRLKLQVEGTTQRPLGERSTQSIDDWKRHSPDIVDGVESAVFRGPSDHLYQFSPYRQAQRMLNDENDRLFGPAISSGFTDVAGLTAERDAMLAGRLSGGPTELSTVLRPGRKGARLTTPTWDRKGVLWVVASTRTHSWLYVRQGDQRPVRVSGWGLEDRGIRALRIARDGVRAAAIVMVGKTAQIHIGRVVRDSKGRIVSVSFLPITSELVDAVDLAWSNAGMLAVLGRLPSVNQVMPYLVPVSGGPVQSMGVGSLGEPQTIAAAPSSSLIIGIRDAQRKSRLCTQKNFRDRFSEWSCVTEGAEPAYVG